MTTTSRIATMPLNRSIQSTAMDDGTDARKHGTKTAATNPRQDRLRQALRENLKRRKSQARGRSEVAAGSQDAAATDDATSKT